MRLSCRYDKITTAVVLVACGLLTAPTAHADSDHMGGDGYHPMGGIDGKNWGTWATAGGEACWWSVRFVSSGAPAVVLDSGEASGLVWGSGFQVRIDPPGPVDVWTGRTEGGRVVFHTSGCAEWERL